MKGLLIVFVIVISVIGGTVYYETVTHHDVQHKAVLIGKNVIGDRYGNAHYTLTWRLDNGRIDVHDGCSAESYYSYELGGRAIVTTYDEK